MNPLEREKLNRLGKKYQNAKFARRYLEYLIYYMRADDVSYIDEQQFATLEKAIEIVDGLRHKFRAELKAHGVGV